MKITQKKEYWVVCIVRIGAKINGWKEIRSEVTLVRSWKERMTLRCMISMEICPPLAFTRCLDVQFHSVTLKLMETKQ